MNKRILLIEDNENNRYLFSYLLKSRGWEVLEAPRVRIDVASHFPADDPQRSDENKCKKREERLTSKSRH